MQAKTVIPCLGDSVIKISPEDVNQLGWKTGISSDDVAVAATMSGTMFVMQEVQNV